MPRVLRHAIVPCDPEQIYRLVCDVDSYHEFLPWCHGTLIKTLDEHTVIARLDIRQSDIALSFSTTNYNTPYKSIRMELAEGPFKKLRGLWEFIPLGSKGCEINFTLDFAVSNSLLHKLAAEKLLGKISSTLVKAFAERARQLYG